MNTFIKISITTIALSCSLILSAETNGHYRWVDETGAVKYSDRPPAGVDAEFIKFASTRTSKPSNQPTNNSATSEPTAGSQLPDKMEVVPIKDPKLCTQATQNLKALNGARIRITEPDGSQRFLTEDEKEGQRDNARKFMVINC